MNFPLPPRSTPPEGLSLKNPWIVWLRQLNSPKHRKETGLFLIEGQNALEGILDSRWPRLAVLALPDRQGEIASLVKALDRDCPVLATHPEALKKLSQTSSVPPVVTVCQWQENSGASTSDLFLCAESLQDPGNCGSLVRSLAATQGAPLVLSEDSVDPTSIKVIRSSAGLWFQNPPQRLPLEHWIQVKKKEGHHIVGTDLSGPAVRPWEVDLTGPVVFVLGNEGKGLSQHISSFCDTHVRLPMSPNVDSLNVSIAGAVLLFEAYRQRLS